MILLKSFFRKKKTKIFLIIFVILFSTYFIIQNFIEYYNHLKEVIDFNHTSMFMISEYNHEEEFKIDPDVKSYISAILFEPGEDEVLTTQNFFSDEYTYENEDSITKITWDSIKFDENNIIVLPISTIDKELNDDEVLLVTQDAIYKKEALSETKNKRVSFKYNEENITLKINDIIDIEKELYPAIYISDNLFLSLKPKMKKNFYIIKANNTLAYDNLSVKWNNLEKNDVFKVIHSINYYKESDSRINSKYTSLISVLEIASIISIVIIILIIIFTTYDLLIEEKSINIIQRELGFSVVQNLKITFSKFILLDFLALAISVIASYLLSFIINQIWNLNIKLFAIGKFLYIVMILIVINVTTLIINKN